MGRCCGWLGMGAGMGGVVVCCFWAGGRWVGGGGEDVAEGVFDGEGRGGIVWRVRFVDGRCDLRVE